MKYCYNCGHITAGDPFYCNSCGRSFDVKLCPRGHPNPRGAEVCSRCGSRDLSTPQPRVPAHVRLFAFLLTLLPGSLLVLISVVLTLALLHAILTNPQWLVPFLFLGMAWVVLAWMWSKLPLWFRKSVRRLLERKRKEDRS